MYQLSALLFSAASALALPQPQVFNTNNGGINSVNGLPLNSNGFPVVNSNGVPVNPANGLPVNSAGASGPFNGVNGQQLPINAAMNGANGNGVINGAIRGALANGNAVEVMTVNPTSTIPNQVFVTSRIDNGNFGQTIVFSPRSGAQDYNVFASSFTGMIALGLVNLLA